VCDFMIFSSKVRLDVKKAVKNIYHTQKKNIQSPTPHRAKHLASLSTDFEHDPIISEYHPHNFINFANCVRAHISC